MTTYKWRKWILCLLAFCALLWLIFDQLSQEHSIRVFRMGESRETLVLDAGHGGFDGGAVSPNGITEQQINLAVAYKVRDLAGLFGIPCVMTRTDDHALDYKPENSVRQNKVADIRARERICKQTNQPVFFSIHLNKFEQEKYYGAQVFYSGNHPDSKVFAQAIQQALVEGIDNGNQRVAKPAGDSIYLMRSLSCPALIIECGFLSNATEEVALCDNSYQTQLAACIVAGYLRA